MLGLTENTDLLDNLYGGIAGEIYMPNIEELFPLQDSQEDFSVPDSKQCPPPEQFSNANNNDFEIIPAEEISAVSLDPSIDIRPRIWDAQAKEWTLLDTGSQASVLKPTPDDRIDPLLVTTSH